MSYTQKIQQIQESVKNMEKCVECRCGDAGLTMRFELLSAVVIHKVKFTFHCDTNFVECYFVKHYCLHVQ